MTGRTAAASPDVNPEIPPFPDLSIPGLQVFVNFAAAVGQIPFRSHFFFSQFSRFFTRGRPLVYDRRSATGNEQQPQQRTRRHSHHSPRIKSQSRSATATQPNTGAQTEPRSQKRKGGPAIRPDGTQATHTSSSVISTDHRQDLEQTTGVFIAFDRPGSNPQGVVNTVVDEGDRTINQHDMHASRVMTGRVLDVHRRH